MPAKLKFIPPSEKNPLEIQFSESYRRRLRALEKQYIQVVEPDFHEKLEMKHWVKRQIAKPEHITVQLLRLSKKELKGNDFEDEEGNLVTESKVGLKYILHEVIADEKSIANGNPPDAFPLSSDTYEIGSYKRPICKIELNDAGNISKSTLSDSFECFYLEATEENIRSIVSKYEKNEKFSMSVVDNNGSNLSVFNEDEFISCSVEDLAEANKNGYLSKDGKKGGVQRYLRDKAEKEKEEEEQTTAGPKKKRQYKSPTQEENNANSS